MLLKYPKSEEKEINQLLANTISSVDNFDSNSNDLIYQSGIKFEFSHDKNYNSTIMEFLNFLISMPNKCEEIIEVDGVK